MPDCDCGYDGGWWACFDGSVYGPCEWDDCGGLCEYKGDCECSCHFGGAL